MYNKQIYLLQCIIDNYDILKNCNTICIKIGEYRFYPYYGLCYNASLEDRDIIINDIIKSWEFYNKELGLTYFIDGVEEYENTSNLFKNPKRLNFAKHALNYLENLNKSIDNK